MTPEYHAENHNGVDVLICDECGKERRCGDWPQCPHIPGLFGQEPLEPYFDEHISASGEYITTRGQRAAIMSREGLEFRKKRLDLLTGRNVHFDMGRK